MNIPAKVWAIEPSAVFLRSLDGKVSILLDALVFEGMKPVGVDVEEGDEVSLDVTIIRRTRPERTI